MKNDRTPRTLADCEFTTGYPSAQPRVTGGLTVAIWLAACVAIGYLFAKAI